MTAEVFESATSDSGDDALGIHNTLSIEHAKYSDAPLVRVDTNYKATRPGQHPVNLSAVDAVKAARAIIEAAGTALNRSEVDLVQSWDLLTALSSVDAEVSDLRDSLMLDLKPKAEG